MQAPPQSIRTEPRPECALCHTCGRPLHQKVHDLLFNAPGLWDFKQCSNPGCDLIWLDPFPLVKDISIAYSNYYTHSPAHSGAARLREILYRIYRGIQTIPGTFVGLRRERLDHDLMYLAGTRPGRLLDVGCGDGRFLARMRGLGWQVEGVDVDAKALEAAKQRFGFDFRHGDIHSVSFPAEHFDAITMNHVIEHVPDPLRVFSESRRLLRTGGVLVIATPNVASFGHAKFGVDWRGLEPPRHLHLFSPRTLAVCARAAGLNVIRADSTAAYADVIAGASFSIQHARAHGNLVQPSVSLTRTLRAMRFQFQENRLIRSGAICGEEAILICQK